MLPGTMPTNGADGPNTARKLTILHFNDVYDVTNAAKFAQI